MTLRNFSSTATQTTLSAGVDASATALAVASTAGLPAVPFILAVDAGAAAQELVLVTNVAGLNLTVTRGYDSTVAAAHSTGAVVAHSHGGIDFREANTHVNATTGAHGTTGAVVGTASVQALTGKTVDLGSNTVTGTKAQFNAALSDADFRTTTDADLLAWTPWTPTVTPELGTFTAASGTGRHLVVGKTVHWTATLTITTVGVSSGAVRFTLPVASRALDTYVGNGRQGSNGNGLQVYATTVTEAFVLTYANGSPIAVGSILLSGTYEAA